MVSLTTSHVKVEANLTAPLPEEIEVETDDGSLFLVAVSYPWLPPTCSHCKKLGHISKYCPDLPPYWETKNQNGSTTIKAKKVTSVVIEPPLVPTTTVSVVANTPISSVTPTPVIPTLAASQTSSTPAPLQETSSSAPSSSVTPISSVTPTPVIPTLASSQSSTTPAPPLSSSTPSGSVIHPGPTTKPHPSTSQTSYPSNPFSILASLPPNTSLPPNSVPDFLPSHLPFYPSGSQPPPSLLNSPPLPSSPPGSSDSFPSQEGVSA